MDPFTALALACAVVQFVDFGFKLLKSTTDIHHSTTGATSQDETIESVTQKLKDLTLDLNHDISSPQNPLESKSWQKNVASCQRSSCGFWGKLSERAIRVSKVPGLHWEICVTVKKRMIYLLALTGVRTS